MKPVRLQNKYGGNKKLMRKNVWTKGLVVGAILLLVGSSVLCVQAKQGLVGNDVQLTYSFCSPTIETIDIAGTLYSRITLPECYPAGSAGEPKIPSKGAFILLPPKTTLSAIDVTPGENIVLGTGYQVEPTSQAIPLSQTENIPIPTPNAVLYHTDAAYPGSFFTNVGVQTFRGYQILVLLLHPVQYNPVTGELSYYQHLQITVKTEAVNTQSSLYRGFQEDQREVAQKVDNPDMVSLYQQVYAPLSMPRDHYDLLILTTDTLKNGFVPLKNAHDAAGTLTVIKTLTDVGASDLDSIRNYIRDVYTNWGISYVLVGGDDGVVPAPMLYVSGMDENVTYYDTVMPSDLFYACLDGPYNYDGDSKWGEPDDGAGGGDVDLVAEVYVGRACVDSTADVTNFVTKTVAYLTTSPEEYYLKQACFVGEYLGDYGIASYSGGYMDELINGSTDDGYTTVGIPASKYTITKLYDSPTYYWDPSELMAIINAGVHLINHAGHSYYDYNMKMYSSDVDALTNDKPCFIYSQGCMSGGFDNPDGYDCIAEEFTVKTSHAAFAGIWNARYGFFWSFSTDGDSQRLHRQFWDAVFGEGSTQLGKANHDSKEDNLAIIGRSCIRWCYYETNLFGDPALSFYQNQSENQPPNPPTIQGSASGKKGHAYTYTFTTTDPEGDNVSYFIDWGDNTTSGWLGPYTSGDAMNQAHTWVTEGTYIIKAKAKDVYGKESTWGTLSVTMPLSYEPHFRFLYWLFERFPNAFPILRHLWGY
jgi:hypothetical protein